MLVGSGDRAVESKFDLGLPMQKREPQRAPDSMKPASLHLFPDREQVGVHTDAGTFKKGVVIVRNPDIDPSR